MRLDELGKEGKRSPAPEIGMSIACSTTLPKYSTIYAAGSCFGRCRYLADRSENP